MSLVSSARRPAAGARAKCWSNPAPIRSRRSSSAGWKIKIDCAPGPSRRVWFATPPPQRGGTPSQETVVSSEIRFAPSILAADFTRLGEQVAEAEAAGATYIHIDIMDGRFVPNITMGPFIVEAVRRATSLPLDVHLMIVEAEKHIQAFADAGADLLSVHVEACPHLHRVLQQIRQAGVRPSVVLNPHTPAVAIKEVLPFVDMILAMTVNPGFGG